MDLRKYLIPLYQAPEPPAGVAVEPPVPPVAEAPPPEPPVEPEAPPEPAPEESHGNKGKKPWFLDRISEETGRRTAAEQRAADAERRLQEAQAVVERLQSANPERPQPFQPPPTPPRDEIDRLASEKAKQLRFYEDTSEVKNAGLRDFGSSFENDLNILNAVGATNDEMVADVLAVDKPNAHKLLNKLASDPERAAALAKMNSRARIAELTRMTMAQAAPVEPTLPAPKTPPKQVSKAPAPPPPVEPSASQVTDWRSDKSSDADFSRGWEENMRKRAGRR